MAKISRQMRKHVNNERRLKISLENVLIRKLRTIFNKFMRDFKVEFKRSATVLNAHSISPQLNNFAALGYVYLDVNFISTLPKGEYDISFQIEGIPFENHGHSILTVTNTGNSLLNNPDPKGWGIDTGVSFDLNFPSLFLLVNLFSIPIIRRLRSKI